MAVDSEVKRRSMLNFSDEHLLPKPDGAIAMADRLQLLGLYIGFATVPKFRGFLINAGRLMK